MEKIFFVDKSKMVWKGAEAKFVWSFIVDHSYGDLARCFTTKLVDVANKAVDLKAGEALYVVTTKNDIIVASSIEALNRLVAMREEEAKKNPAFRAYCAGVIGFSIRRTEKSYLYQHLFIA